MDKAIEIKRRAQRFIQSGDLDGALVEYERLVALPDVDPYNFVLLADLLYKQGKTPGSVERYLAAAAAYESTGLYKNAIAVCKKMMRLSLAPARVLERLAQLHGLDGLATEASLYYQQFAEHLVRENRAADAAVALRKACDATPEDVRLLERLSELLVLADAEDDAAAALAEAAFRYRQRGMEELARACQERAEQMKPGVMREHELQRLVASGATETASDPGAGTDDEDEAAYSGPPLLPGLRGDEPVSPTPASDIERFPATTGRDFGLRFDDPSAAGKTPSKLRSAEEIEAMLAGAQERVRNGDHAGAATILIDAAHAYEAVGRHDNAATIYRSIAKSPGSPNSIVQEWLANCERRDDQREAAVVACELGDRAITAGHHDEARSWFERALRFDEGCTHAQRRLQRLDQIRREAEAGPPQMTPVETMPSAVAASIGPPTPVPVEPANDLAPTLAPVHPAPASVPPPDLTPDFIPMLEPVAEGAPPSENSTSRVELAVGRSEAVSYDLGSLLAEFQRGIESQLAGDAQGHYDLAMAYREMGLLDHAIDSFRLAGVNPSLASRATEMLGRCLLDQGCFEEASQELGTALERPDLDHDAIMSLRYLLGLAYEAGGRESDALREFQGLFEQQSNYQDVAQKVRDLRKTLGSS